MEKAINAYHKVTVSPEFRNLERMREDAYYNHESAIWNAEMKGKMEIIQLLQSGKSLEEVIYELKINN